MGSFRVRRHANPLKSQHLVIPVERISTSDGRPLEVELGSAEGEFVFARARVEPSADVVGVEIRRDMVDRVEREARGFGLGNAKSVFANISVDLPRLFAPGSVRRFFVNFPDPWFKSRQKKRRVLGPDLAADMREALKEGGEVYVMTDIFDIALEGMAALEGAGLVNLRGPWSFFHENPWRAQSRREVTCLEMGRPIWRLHYRK